MGLIKSRKNVRKVEVSTDTYTAFKFGDRASVIERRRVDREKRESEEAEKQQKEERKETRSDYIQQEDVLQTE